MNAILEGIILGLTQGLTEFLPVSSSGHLVLLESFGIGEQSTAFNLMLHLATLLAVVIFYRKKILSLIKHPTGDEMKFLLIATIPTAVMAGVIRYLIPIDSQWLPFCFAVTSVILVLPKILKPKTQLITKKRTLSAIILGVMQGVACINGISRSGTTVSTLRMLGESEEKTAETSFLLSIPIILGSSIVEIAFSKQKFTLNIGEILGMVVAFLSGLVAIKFFVSVLKKDKFFLFSIYTFLMSILSFVLPRVL